MAQDMKPPPVAPGVSMRESDLSGNAQYGFGQNVCGSTAVGREKGNRVLDLGPQVAPAGGSSFKRVRKG